MRILLLCLLLSGLGSAESAMAADAEIVSLEISHLGGREGWEARYRLSAPTTRLAFLTPFGSGRRSWQLRSLGMQLVAGENGDAIQATRGRTFKEVVLRLRSNTEQPPSQYPLNRRFTDGSELLYYGHLYARPARTSERPLSYTVTLRPRPDEQVVVRGQRFAQATQWTEDLQRSRGTFAYFGTLPAVESRDIIAVVDPQFPPGLRAAFDVELPRLLQYFTRQLGVALSQRPQLFISLLPEGAPQLGGDVLPGAISFEFAGTDWRDDTAEQKAAALQLIAHETAHLWNGDAFLPAQEDAPWMHEGGADALAWIALHDLELLSDTDLLGNLSDALNQCVGVQGLARRSLQQAAREGRYELAYSCGSVMNFLVHADLRQRGGILKFWSTLFERSRASERRYSVDTYFAALEALSSSTELLTTLRTLWSTGGDVRGTLLREFERSQLPAKPGTASPDYAAASALTAVSLLMAADCGGSYSIDRLPAALQVHGQPHCTNLRSDVLVNAVAGRKIGPENALVYAALFEQCAQEKAVEIKGPKMQAMQLSCPRDLPPPLPYLQVQMPGWMK